MADILSGMGLRQLSDLRGEFQPVDDQPLVRRLGVVSAVSAGPPMTCTVQMWSATIAGVACLDYVPVVGDTCVLLSVGGDMVAIGTTGGTSKLHTKGTAGAPNGASSQAADNAWHNWTQAPNGPLQVTFTKQLDAAHTVLDVDVRGSMFVDGANEVLFGLSVDGGAATQVSQFYFNQVNVGYPVPNFRWKLTGLAAGSHTVTLQVLGNGVFNMKCDSTHYYSMDVTEIASF